MIKSSSVAVSYHSLYPEDGESKVCRNIVVLPQYYTASQPREPRRGFHRCENLRSRFLIFFFPQIKNHTLSWLGWALA
jgi:hypothetical protein